MTAAEKFETLLKKVQESNLNYSMQKTPFSAIISLKCTFIKRFPDVQSPKNEQINVQVSDCDYSDSAKELEHENLQSENKALKKELTVLKEAFTYDLKHETLRIEELYRAEKEKSVNAEKKVKELREEILKVKKEKHEISSEMKSVKSLASDQETKINQLVEKVKSAEKAMKSKDNPVNVKAAEATDQKDKIRELKSTLDDMNEKLAQITKMKSEKDELSCNLCSLKVKNLEDMKKHTRAQHCQSKATQSEIHATHLFDYTCFYCDELVKSEEHLRNHRSTCHESFPCDFLCFECGSKFNRETDLEMHKTTKHGPFAPIQKDIKVLQTTSTFIEESCDFCDKKCLNLGELRDHMRSQHMDILPS
jgi:hypothetical protein